MAKCSKCNQPATKDGLCKNHQPEIVAQKQKVIDDQKAKIAKDLATRQPVMKAMAVKAAKNQDTAAAKSKKVAEIAATWNTQVQAVVTQVKNLRAKNSKVKGINAGTNAVGTTLGGNKNPLKFTVPTNTFGILPKDVFEKMTGFDNSDSGVFKFRIGDILVHGH